MTCEPDLGLWVLPISAAIILLCLLLAVLIVRWGE